MLGFGYFGVAPDLALAASVMFGLLMLVFSLWGGLLWWVDRHSQAGGGKVREPADNLEHRS